MIQGQLQGRGVFTRGRCCGTPLSQPVLRSPKEQWQWAPQALRLGTRAALINCKMPMPLGLPTSAAIRHHQVVAVPRAAPRLV